MQDKRLSVSRAQSLTWHDADPHGLASWGDREAWQRARCLGSLCGGEQDRATPARLGDENG